MQTNAVSLNTFLSRHGRAIILLIALATLAAIAHSIIHFVHVIRTSEPMAQMNVPVVMAPAVALPGMAEVAKMGWFGISPQEQAPASSQINILSQFVLRGVSASGQASLVGAFIAEKGGQEKYYHVGDALPQNAGTVEEVAPDHVSIRNGQGLVTLNFEEAPR